MASYCKTIQQGRLSSLHQTYHDTLYGFPAVNDNELFGKMLLEMNQAGLSWDIVLKKSDTIKAAYANFEISEVAQFDEDKVEDLLNNSSIIRMRAKINAAIFNAKVIIDLQKSHGSFGAWLDAQHPLSVEDWIKRFKKNFKFMGKETTKEFLMASGYIKGAHDDDCPIQSLIIEQKPKWLD